MMRSRLLLPFAMLVCLFGCNTGQRPEIEGDGVFSKTYISMFVAGNEMTLRVNQPGTNTIEIYIDGTEIPGGDLFDSLCEQVGDTYYNRKVPNIPNRTATYSNRFASIDIVSSAPFGSIAAGQSLAGVVMYRSATAKPFIDSGYKEEFTWLTDMPEEFGLNGYTPYYPNDGYTPVVKLLSAVEPADMLLIPYRFMSLRFTEVPEIKAHTFTVTLREGQKELRGTIDYVFK